MRTNMNLFIRADGNQDIATGHIMRCLSIADACVDEAPDGVHLTFLVSDKVSKELLLNRLFGTKKLSRDNVDIIVLNSDYRDLVSDFDSDTFNSISWDKVDVLLIDSYHTKDEYFSKLRQMVTNNGLTMRVAYMDDFYRRNLPLDIVVNYDADAIERSGVYDGIPTKLLGFSYTPLRSMFEEAVTPTFAENGKILLTAGGSYIDRAMDKLMPYIQEFINKNSLELHILLGRELTSIEESVNSEDRSIYYHPYISNMAEFLKDFSLVVSAGGTTLKEVCAVGVPCVSFALGDDQVINAIGMEKAGLIPYIGDLRTDDYKNKIIDILNSVISPEYQHTISVKMKNAIDGKGARRIAKALLEG